MFVPDASSFHEIFIQVLSLFLVCPLHMQVPPLSVVDSTVITMLGGEYRFCCLLLCSTFHFYFIMRMGYISAVQSDLWISVGLDHFVAIDTVSHSQG